VAQLGLYPAPAAGTGRGVDADLLLRTFLLAAVLLLLWISFSPFEDLSVPPEVTDAGQAVNQIGYSLLFIVLAAWCFIHEPRRLRLLVRPLSVAVLLWLALSVAASWEPALSARRLAFTLVIMGIAGMILLLPKNVRHFGDVLAAVVLIVLAVCYIGVFITPSFAIHQPTDYAEPKLAGDWRGVFGHKNAAGSAMAAFIFIGLFVTRVRSIVIGAVIVGLSFTFLIFSHSKTSIVILPLALAVSMVMVRVRRPAVGIALALSILVGLNIFSVGSIYFEPVHSLLNAVLTDSSFTGRDEVWQFAADHMLARPFTGYGFAAFWGTPGVVYGPSGGESWAQTASHAHNGYLDLALTIGIPGAALVTLWLVISPIVDFYRSSHQSTGAALELLFLRICLFAAFASAFESMVLVEGTGSLLLFAAAFGLRFLSLSSAKA
jgi:O-antigen ligase